MFPTTTKNPFPYSTETTLLKKPFPWDNKHQNPSYAQELLEPPFFLHFPSPFLDDENQDMPLTEIFSQQTARPVKNNNTISPTTSKTKGANKKKTIIIAGSSSRRRTGKKDRHSKICTAQGVRDRRMRLSLQIARKFFDLQDMLGFDKASSTIDWLLSQSKTAIKELITSKKKKNNYNGSSSSTDESAECDEVANISSMDDDVAKDNNNNLKKESREKARARARERTKEKMMIKTNPFLLQENRTEKYLGAAGSTVASIFHQNQNMRFFGNNINWELAPLISSGNPSASSSFPTLDFLLLDQQNNFSSSCNQY